MSEETTPLLSVILPTHNGLDYLPRALDSLEGQARDRLEVIAVDDGSTDGTPDLLRSYEGRLPITVIERAHTGNWVSSTNVGLEEARAPFVSILHQDDRWLPRRVENIEPHLREGEAPLVLHPVWFVDDSGRRLGRWRCPLPPGRALHPTLVMPRLLVQNFVSVPGATFDRRAALGRGLDEKLWYTADWDLWLGLAATGPTTYLPVPLAEFRLHRAAQTIWGSVDSEGFAEQMRIVLDRHGGTGHDGVEGFSIDLNTALARASHGGGTRPLLRLVPRFLSLGPRGWRRFLRDSRIHERVAARLRAGLASRPRARRGDP